MVILSPDRPAMIRAILGVVDCILEGDNHGQQPSDDCQHLVSDNGVLAVLVAFRKRVDWVGEKRLVSNTPLIMRGLGNRVNLLW